MDTPIAFLSPPTLEQAIDMVNSNTSRVRQMQSTSAKLSIPSAPDLRASFALQQPMRFRLQAGTGITGAELDLGSNDSLFWFWAKRNQPANVFFARHDQYADSHSSGVFPVPPQWLIEALGLVYFDPQHQHRGPTVPGPGRLAIQSEIEGPQGPVTRVVVLDDRRGFVMQQLVYDSSNQLLAVAIASEHRFDSENQVTLPGKVDIQFPQEQMGFTLLLGDTTVNQLTGDPLQLWEMPKLEEYPYVNLASPHVGKSQPIIPVSAVRTATRRSQSPSSVDPWWRRYRGY